MAQSTIVCWSTAGQIVGWAEQEGVEELVELGEKLEEDKTVPEGPDSELLADNCVSDENPVEAASSGGNDDDCEPNGFSLLAAKDDDEDGRPVERVVSSEEVNKSVKAEESVDVVARSVEKLGEAEKDVCDGADEPSDSAGEAEEKTNGVDVEDDSRDAKLLDVRADALELVERVLDLQCMIQDQVEHSKSEKLTLFGSRRSQTLRRS